MFAHGERPGLGAMKILILKPSSLGDVIQALPVARLLKQHRPEAEIHWWLNRELTPLLEGDPDLFRVIPFDRKRWGRLEGVPLAISEIRALRRERFDWVIDLQSLARSALVGWLARGGLTVGLDERREAAPAFFDVAVPRPSFETHAVDWYLEVLRRLDVPVHFNFTWLPERPGIAATVRARCPAPSALWVALQPGARWPNKRWPIEHFVDLARRLLAAEPALRVVVLGGHTDQAFGSAITAAAGPRSLDLTGRLSLPEMVEWLRLCTLMITNDTGPMHVAAALGKPVVALFGPTEAARTGPYGDHHTILRMNLPCAPCLKSECHWAEPLACLRQISPGQVADTVLSRLKVLLPVPCPERTTA